MLGFFTYFRLYAGNWDFFILGWSLKTSQSYLNPGFYQMGMLSNIPVIGSPLTLLIFIASSIVLWTGIEKQFSIPCPTVTFTSDPWSKIATSFILSSPF